MRFLGSAVGPHSVALLVAFAMSCAPPRSSPPDAMERAAVDAASAADAALPSGQDGGQDSGPDGGGLSSAAFVMDAKFRSDLAGGLVAQAERADWAAFLPAEGTSHRQGARVNLAGGGLTSASWTRACTTTELEARHAQLLRQVASDLTRRDRSFPQDGFTCAKDTCTAQYGEMGFNGDLVFARRGDAVRLVAVSDHEVSVTKDTERAIDRANRALRPPPACRRP